MKERTGFRRTKAGPTRPGRSAAERAVEEAAEARDAALSAAGRRERGVVHTPWQVARFVARRVDEALRTLGRAGIADPDVALVDLACGPGVFLAGALAEAQGPGPRVALGLEVAPDVVRVADRTLRPAADAAGWPLRVDVADTLAGPVPLTPTERDGATLAILGNPPWAGKSANRGAAYADRLLDDFKKEHGGGPLAERKLGVLSDDYVRFWRWSCEAAREADGGAVVALVTNASFLDGPVHRGMRGALSRWFASIDVFDLGGSALVARRGDRDENVFGVRPGAVITVAVRPADHAERGFATVRYAALRGSRSEKLTALEADEVALAPVAPAPPWFRFAPGPRAEPAYAQWPALPALIPFHREGLQTNRDAFCVDASRDALLERLRGFADGRPGPWPGRAGTPSGHYDPDAARAETRAALETPDPRAVRRVAYRPLDDRWVAAIPKLCHRPRAALLDAMDRSEIALLTVRKDRGERPWAHFGVTRHAVDNCYSSTRSSCRTRAFPTHRPDGTPNLDEAAVRAWAPALEGPSPRALLRYVLCVLAAPAYRARFDAHLRADYPRIPPPPSRRAFEACVRAGGALEAVFLEDRGSDAATTASPAASPDAPPLVLGHHRLTGPWAEELGRRIDACERALRPVLSACVGTPD